MSNLIDKQLINTKYLRIYLIKLFSPIQSLILKVRFVAITEEDLSNKKHINLNVNYKITFLYI